MKNMDLAGWALCLMASAIPLIGLSAVCSQMVTNRTAMENGYHQKYDEEHNVILWVKDVPSTERPGDTRKADSTTDIPAER